MRYIIALILCGLPALSFGQEWEDRRVFNENAGGPVLRILSSTDTSFFAPIIEGFLTTNRTLTVEYVVTSTARIPPVFRAQPDAFDLVISSAMDLQLKLANDGYALRINGLNHPPAAEWRESLFAFTSEPAAIVVNLNAFTNEPLPETRQDLIRALRARPEVFEGRVGTYDIRQSGLGYLFATQDARASETYWRLMEVMGALQTRLYCCSSDMIDDLASGELMVAYNVLESYAAARVTDDDTLAIILPSDFPTTMMRTALVSAASRSPELAASFIEHLISLPQTDLPLPALKTRYDGVELATIALEPALMTYLDTLKKRTFLTEWENAVIQPAQ